MDYTAQMLGKSYSRGPLLEWGDMLPQMEVNKNAMKRFGGMGVGSPWGCVSWEKEAMSKSEF